MAPIKHFLNNKGRILAAILPLFLFMPKGAYASFMYKGLEIMPTASVQESYDDNITYTKSSPISDEITHMLVGLGVTQQGKTESLNFNGSVDEQIYAKNTAFDNTSESFTANYQQEISEYSRFKVDDIFSNSQNPTTFSDAFGRTSGRFTTLDNKVDLLFSHDMTEQLTYNVGYSNEQTIFDTDSQTNSSLNTAGAGLDYALNSANILSLNYNYSQRDFATGPYAITNEIAPNLRHFFTKQLYLDLSAGVDFLRSFNGISYIRPLYTATLTNDIDKNTSASISYQQKYTTDTFTQDLFNIWEIVANVTRQLTDKLSIIFSGFWGQGKYITIGGNQGLTGASITVNYDLTKKTSLNAGYTFYNETSNIGLNAYTKNTAFFGITIRF